MAREVSVESVCRLIDALLIKGYPGVDDMAQLLGISPRTFQRMLHGEGVSYAELVDRCRCTTACNSLEHTQKPIREIAVALGYRDASSFSRAFRRWTGRAPSSYRNQSPGRVRDGSAQAGQIVSRAD